MLTSQENDLLCRVEGDAPMGGIFRRHWMPACLIEEVLEPDGDPVKVRLLGEDLVIFRNSLGKIGILDEHCPHRRASLVFGRNEACGLRCLYHGWKIDVEGNVVEMSSETPNTGFVDKVKHKNYPSYEAAGFVWIYMGPRETMPDFEMPFFAPSPETKISIAKIMIDCNWAQILEGAIDSAHSSSLHSSEMVPARVSGAEATDTNWLRPSTDKSPRIQVQRTGYGFRYAAIRRPIINSDTHDYIRTTLFVAPYSVLIPPNNIYNVAILQIPSDDTHTAFHFIAWGGLSVPSTEEWRKFLNAQISVDLDKGFRKIRTKENNYFQDRKAMKLGNFTGIKGIPNQDIAMWETMGPIANRSQERLGGSDIAIVEFRRQMVDAAKKYLEIGAVIGRTGKHIPHTKLRSFEGVVPKSTNWRSDNLSPEELSFEDASTFDTKE